MFRNQMYPHPFFGNPMFVNPTTGYERTCNCHHAGGFMGSPWEQPYNNNMYVSPVDEFSPNNYMNNNMYTRPMNEAAPNFQMNGDMYAGGMNNGTLQNYYMNDEMNGGEMNQMNNNMYGSPVDEDLNENDYMYDNMYTSPMNHLSPNNQMNGDMYVSPTGNTQPSYHRPDFRDHGGEPYVLNIEEAAERNNNYRTAIWTGDCFQVTLMSIDVGDDIGLEVHPDTDQFLRIEKGQGLVEMGETRDNLTFRRGVSEDDAIMVPAGMWHNVTNTGNSPLKLYVIYAPPEHPFGTVHRTKAEAMEEESNY